MVYLQEQRSWFNKWLVFIGYPSKMSIYDYDNKRKKAG